MSRKIDLGPGTWSEVVELDGKKYKTGQGADVSREELVEGKIYLHSLIVNHEIKTNRCLFAIINGVFSINREANWQDVVDDFIPSSYMPIVGAEIPPDLKAFKLVGKLEMK